MPLHITNQELTKIHTKSQQLASKECYCLSSSMQQLQLMHRIEHFFPIFNVRTRESAGQKKFNYSMSLKKK